MQVMYVVSNISLAAYVYASRKGWLGDEPQTQGAWNGELLRLICFHNAGVCMCHNAGVCRRMHGVVSSSALPHAHV
jgi:hypothetical protein